MKKIVWVFGLLIFSGILAGCGGNPEQTVETNSVEVMQQDGAVSGNPDFELPLQTRLILGSFELEGTENEITSQQAAQLVPLWQVLKNLQESETAAWEEINALANQISETMTEAQMTQINNMAFGPESMRTLLSELGLSDALQPPEGSEGEGNRGTQRPEGMPAGMEPGSGAGSEGLSPEQIESMQATREAGGGGIGRGMGGSNNTELIVALIELLQSK
jgi:hypothetical protein